METPRLRILASLEKWLIKRPTV
jgi:hypothetical protein